jgi:sporulation protein YlmC with PRC-barrel domain
MRLSYLFVMILSSTAFVTVANAQNIPQQVPERTPPMSSPYVTVAMKHPGYWRASKLEGVNVYNNTNEKIGDIKELLIDPSGTVAGIVIGVGGFLGVGEHDVLVKLDQIKFVNEPIRSASSEQRPATNAPANTTGSGTERPSRTANEKWYPDHAVMNVTRDQLKSMPAFKYSDYE